MKFVMQHWLSAAPISWRNPLLSLLASKGEPIVQAGWAALNYRCGLRSGGYHHRCAFAEQRVAQWPLRLSAEEAERILLARHPTSVIERLSLKSQR
ncbi:hypothetical protein KCP69_12875 [Salmonella enterica subsp. enterica]|nr:hypothetical protein KCP69_12875 [Salmonella enterica subsp. enterica]